MDLPIYLAMTAHELQNAVSLPAHLGWMSCHFSQSTWGLSNLPPKLPEGSLLILDDAVPMAAHDPRQILRELEGFWEDNPTVSLLLDFQRPPVENTLALVKSLSALPCPMAAPPDYACDGAVFLPPVPAYILPEEFLKPWQGREIWLEAALSCHRLTLTQSQCIIEEIPPQTDLPLHDEALCCHYRMEVLDTRAQFALCRQREDLMTLLKKGIGLGVEKVVGLYQELGK